MKKIYMLLITGFIVSVVACEDDSQFSITPSLGFLESEGSVSQADTVDVYFYSNVELDEAVSVQVQVSDNDLEYGAGYTTSPAAVDGIITVTTDTESGEGKFTVYTVETGDEEAKKVNFQIISVSGGGVQPAQSAALVYTLTIKAYDNSEPVDVTYNFNSCSGTSLEGFTEYVASTAMWSCSSYGYPSSTTSCAYANAYGKGASTSNAYLILDEPVPASDYTITAQVYSYYSGSGTIKFRYSTTYPGSGDPEADGVTWTDITAINSGLPLAASRTWTAVSGTITASGGGDLYIAIQYTGATTSSASSWYIDDVKISNQ